MIDPSIYKIGGGSGGYKDGGQVVDADLMELKNNTLSYYENTSRAAINFYFDTDEGEIINAIVELNTAVNSTVNVYGLRNGLYYLLGNIGGNTVTSGNDYKIIIIGNSFAIEQVTDVSSEPEYAYINGEIYSVKKYNGVIWTTQNARGVPTGAVLNPASMTTTEPACWINPNHTESYYYNILAARLFEGNGWRLPTKDEVTGLYSTIAPGGNSDVNNVKSTTGWIEGNGTNSSGFNVTPNGYVQYPAQTPVYYAYGYQSFFWTKTEVSNVPIVSKITYDSIKTTNYSYDRGLSVRLVYDP